MRITGVIAEYDPFHLGHAWHLSEARRRTQADYVVVVMSSAFVQRGEPALLSPADRARMALAAGADAVIALPAMWAVRDAEHFALGGVSILSALGCSAIAFGAEDDDLSRLSAAARLIEQPDNAFRAAMRTGLDNGLPYPAVLSAACDARLPGAAALLAAPNNTLALCYLRALLRLDSGMEPCAIRRSSDYHATSLTDALPSATAVRSALLRGDWRGVRASVPEAVYAILADAAASHRLCLPGALDQALLYRLRTMADDEWRTLPGLSEGIEDRVRTAARSAQSREALLNAVKSRRYPYARLSRLCTHALMGLTQPLLDETPLPPAAWLLGFREDARPLLSVLSKGRIPLISKAADYDADAAWFRAEVRAYDLWCLGAGLPTGLAFTQGVARV